MVLNICFCGIIFKPGLQGPDGGTHTLERKSRRSMKLIKKIKNQLKLSR